jgi:hypothetical protein
MSENKSKLKGKSSKTVGQQKSTAAQPAKKILVKKVAAKNEQEEIQRFDDTEVLENHQGDVDLGYNERPQSPSGQDIDPQQQNNDSRFDGGMRRVDDRYDADDRFDREEGDHFAADQMLLAPEPREGMVQRWVRTVVTGSDGTDGTNYTRKIRSGWTPRPTHTVPEEFQIAYGAKSSDDTGGVLRVAEMVLMELPIEKHQKLKQRNRQAIDARTEAIDHDLAKTVKGAGPQYGGFTWDEKKVVAQRGSRSVKVADD